MNIYVILGKNSVIYNPKSHDLLFKYLGSTNLLSLDYNETINFINNNNNNNTTIFFYNQSINLIYDLKIIEYLQNLKEIKSLLVFCVFDFWYHPWRNHEIYNKYIRTVFKAKNHKVLTFSLNIEQLNTLHNTDYKEYGNNIMFNTNLWSCYEKSILQINPNPINKILISGCLGKNYPERITLTNLSNKYLSTLNYNSKDIVNNDNNYSLNLNKYFACFTSSVYVTAFGSSTLINTNIILLKTFEILASGSLLVMPLSEKKYLEEINIIHNVNCYLINFDEDLDKQINYIFENIEYYDNVRKNGHELSKIFTPENVFNKIKMKLNI